MGASGSPYSQSHAAYGYNVNDTSVPTKIGQNYGIHGQSSSQFSNHLPTPTQTPTQDSFLSTSYPNSYSHGGEMNSVMAASMAMNNNIDTHSNADDELPGMSHSGRQSVSSMGQDPSTPRTIPESYDDGFRVPQNDQQMRFPKLDRTVSDAYNDALFTGSKQVPATRTDGTITVADKPRVKRCLTIQAIIAIHPDRVWPDAATVYRYADEASTTGGRITAGDVAAHFTATIRGTKDHLAKGCRVGVQ